MNSDQSPENPAEAPRTGAIGHLVDPERTVWITSLDDSVCRAAMAALANTTGGQVVIAAGWSAMDVERMAAQIDPSLVDLVSTRIGAFPEVGQVVIVDVRQSADAPHIDAQTGVIYEQSANGIVPVTGRKALDRLYRKGRAADSRVERSIDGMIERMQLASFGHFGLAVLACLRSPSAEPYLWAAEHPDELVAPSDPFVSEWAFSPVRLKVKPGDLELRGERDITGVMRITRGGCVAIGETRRKPPGEVIGSPQELQERLQIMLATACRILGREEDSVIVPRLLCEGLRGTKLSVLDQTVKPATVDTLTAAGTAGSANDLSYQTALAQELMQRLLVFYGVEPDTHELW